METDLSGGIIRLAPWRINSLHWTSDAARLIRVRAWSVQTLNKHLFITGYSNIKRMREKRESERQRRKERSPDCVIESEQNADTPV
ncbi:1274_t:CDS:2 [Paraglomus occultum]|uniref:1274_t:CDS:1 n=1 Tax=Paraglomus occultum TaxID=144539 RepID=A0A9N9AT76_9GLOM|nr:1274_t:CDS:2 [Paraglomus occultum]